MYRIGLDVGGTNTDAVLMRGNDVVSWTKTPTTLAVEEGIARALGDVLSSSGAHRDDVSAVMIGTTHFTNALVERRRLGRVAAIRACLPANTAVPIGAGWPAEMVAALDLRTFMVHGGFNFDSRPISAIDFDEIDEVAAAIGASGIRSIAIAAAFSPLVPEGEERIADALRTRLPDIAISLSNEVGRIGLLERENATILNAALMDLADATFAGFERSLTSVGLSCPLFISQNDGTVMSARIAARYPVRTLASGPTNSMRGAVFLTGLDRAVVLDIGGTTTDAGALTSGFPREAAADLSVEGIRTNFRMPDVLSIGLGGGSLVQQDDHGINIGPTSVGYAIATEALVFGGQALTTTDVAVRNGLAEVGDAAAVAGIDGSIAHDAMARWHADVDDLIAKVRGSAERVPVIVVGGGSILIDETLLTEADDCIKPDYFQVANAVGASIPQASGEVDRVVSLGMDRDATLAECRQEAIELAVAAGAEPASVVIHDEEVITLNLLGSDTARIRVRAVGAIPVDDMTRFSR